MKYLRLILAGWLFVAGAAWSQVGQIPTYVQPPPVSGPTYSFLAIATSSATGATLTTTQNIGSLSATKLVIVATTYQAGESVTSVTVGGVGLSKVVAVSSQSEIWAGTISSLSGSQSIVATWDAGSFDARTASIWVADGLSSNTVKNTGSSSGDSATINITSGDLLFATAVGTGTCCAWNGSSQTPSASHTSSFLGGSADWTTSVTNASFSVSNASGVQSTVAASWR